MQNVECRMQNEEGTPEIFRNRCRIRSGVRQGSGAKGTFKCGARSAECGVENAGCEGECTKVTKVTIVDSLAPARSALAGLCLRPDSFRRFPSGSSAEVTIQIPNAARVSQVSQVKNHTRLREASAFIGFRRDPPSPRLRCGKQDDATGPFSRRNRGKYAPHKICSVRIPFECGIRIAECGMALTPTLSHPMGEGEVVHALGEEIAVRLAALLRTGMSALRFRSLLRAATPAVASDRPGQVGPSPAESGRAQPRPTKNPAESDLVRPCPTNSETFNVQKAQRPAGACGLFAPVVAK